MERLQFDEQPDYSIGAGYAFDLTKAVDARQAYRDAMSSDKALHKHNMVRTAVLLARAKTL